MGERGLRGYKGIQGRQGELGPAGPTGLQGISGPEGDLGPEGKQGNMGPQGIQGDPGENGITFEDLREESINIVNELMEQEQRDLNAVTLEELEKFREEFDSRIRMMSNRIGVLATSSGGGEVNLQYLDDVDTSLLGNDSVLRYDATAGKFKFATQNSLVAEVFQEAAVVVDAGVSILDEETGIYEPLDW